MRAFKGAFCIPDAFDNIPYGDGRRIWTVAYGGYDDAWRAKIRDAYKARGYTHFPLNYSGYPYGDDYPHLAADPERMARDLSELIADGLIPVLFVLDDTRGADTSYAEAMLERCKDLIWIAVPMWEQNMILEEGVWLEDEKKWNDNQTLTIHKWLRSRLPDAYLMVHFTPSHGAGGDNEPQWWQDMHAGRPANDLAPKTINGFLCQMDEFDDPAQTGRGMESTGVRLNGTQGGWEGCDLDTINFECQTTELFHNGRSEQVGGGYMAVMWANQSSLTGWCDTGLGDASDWYNRPTTTAPYRVTWAQARRIRRRERP